MQTPYSKLASSGFGEIHIRPSITHWIKSILACMLIGSVDDGNCIFWKVGRVGLFQKS